MNAYAHALGLSKRFSGGKIGGLWKHGRNLEYKINVDLPNFYGGSHIEGFMDVISQVENFFRYMEIPQEKWVKLLVFKLKGAASHSGNWYRIEEKLQESQTVRSWVKMQRIVKEYFLLSNYKQQIYLQY